MAPIDRTLLDRYMQGACSPEEEALVHRWLDEEDLEDNDLSEEEADDVEWEDEEEEEGDDLEEV